ncbi:MAG: oxidoreductase protein [Acidimicrobiaceae bacterium]|nr:oxidoreductase protein [Acidimicrobiaceae bacterium]
MVTTEPLRWGLLGCGWVAGAFARELALTDSGRPVAVGSRSQESADRFADTYDIPNRHASYEALVADPSVEVVYVATPHPMHCANALLALEAGKPVLVEKPFAMNAAEAREVIDSARAKGLFAMEAMWTRFLPHVGEIRRLLAEGALGDIVMILADNGHWIREDPSSRLFSPELGGGALLDIGVYPLSFVSMILGKPDRIVALSEPASTGVDKQTSILLGFASGAQAMVNCSFAANSGTRATIVGTDARIEMEGPFFTPTPFTLVPREGEPTRFEPRGDGGGFRNEADEVARCIRSGVLESPLMTLDETLSIMATMDTVLAQVNVTSE